jgi:branched-chain amino acid transport system ATP-binding protein
MAAELLRADRLQTGYQRVQVLWGVDISVEEGETVVLLGANGAGKTTLLKALVGLLPAWNGSIAFAGRDITHLRTDLRIHLGIAYMSELGVFPSLTIDENIRVGGHLLPGAELNARARGLYAIFPDLERRRHALASSLSGGQRKMLGIAKALAGKPKLLIMDEPSAGLSPVYVQEVVRALDKSRGHGLSLLVAEQNVKFLDLADRVYTLEGGRVSFQGTVSEMHDNNALYQAYFGLRRSA